MDRLAIGRLIRAGLCLLISVLPVSHARDFSGDEGLIKAVFVFNFAKFTRWPDGVWADIGEPLQICALGQDPLVKELQGLTGKTIQGHSVTVRQLESAPIPDACHVLYVATSMQDGYRDVITSLSARAVLTVSEIPQFARQGGMVQLYARDGRIRFNINLSAAGQAGLELSSRLLRLASPVTEAEAR